MASRYSNQASASSIISSSSASRRAAMRPPPGRFAKRRTRTGRQKERPALAGLSRFRVLLVLAVVAGVLGDRVEGVHLSVAIPAVVAGAALALLDGAAIHTRERQVPGGQRRRTRLRVGRLLHVR